MPLITFIEASGERHPVEIPEGTSIMQGAVDNMVPGIVAECGGSCSCGTCHIYIDGDWLAESGAREALEDEMLNVIYGVESNSRLSCQVQVTASMHGMIVRLPESQF